MKIKKFESYDLNSEYGNDFGEEHAKVLISKFIEEELNGFTMEDTLEWVGTEYDLPEDLKEAVIYSAKIYVSQLKRMIDELL